MRTNRFPLVSVVASVINSPLLSNQQPTDIQKIYDDLTPFVRASPITVKLYLVTAVILYAAKSAPPKAAVGIPTTENAAFEQVIGKAIVIPPTSKLALLYPHCTKRKDD